MSIDFYAYIPFLKKEIKRKRDDERKGGREKKKEREIMVSVLLPSYLNQFTDFHEIPHKHYSRKDHPE
jgi:hypothetical protein